MKDEKNEDATESEETPVDISSLFGDSDFKTISIYGEIDEDTGKSATLGLQLFKESEPKSSDDDDDADPPRIDMIVSTEGGNVQDMFAIYDCVRDVRKNCDIHTLGIGKVMSAGILLLASGTPGKRTVGKYCRLMMHSVKGAHFGSLKELESDIREVRWYQEQFIKALAEETKLSYKELKAIFPRKSDTYFDALQAVEWGIADEVV